MISWTFSKRQLGELLVEFGHITEQQLERALAEPRRCGERIGQTLMRLGFIDRRQLTLALTRQYFRAFFGAIGMMAVTFHPELAAAALARAQLSISATVVTAAAASLRFIGSSPAPGSSLPGKVAVTLACAGDARALVGIEGGRFAPGGMTRPFDYVQTWRSATAKTLTCGADPRSVKVAVRGSSEEGAPGQGLRAVNITIDY
jgi:hypothetical protein